MLRMWLNKNKIQLSFHLKKQENNVSIFEFLFSMQFASKRTFIDINIKRINIS